jgi:hypothetical protein
LTKVVALEEGKHGVRCNIVCPGGGNAEMISEFFANHPPDSPLDATPARATDPLPLGRRAELSELAGAVLGAALSASIRGRAAPALHVLAVPGIAPARAGCAPYRAARSDRRPSPRSGRAYTSCAIPVRMAAGPGPAAARFGPAATPSTCEATCESIRARCAQR